MRARRRHPHKAFLNPSHRINNSLRQSLPPHQQQPSQTPPTAPPTWESSSSMQVEIVVQNGKCL
ncbi:MAG: hypothetical protein U1U88_001522 [Lawsonella clevelandensis]